MQSFLHYYHVELAVIRQDFHYIQFRGINCSLDKQAAINYYEWMKKFFEGGCHAYLRLVGPDIQESVVELNVPEGEYIVPPLRQAA